MKHHKEGIVTRPEPDTQPPTKRAGIGQVQTRVSKNTAEFKIEEYMGRYAILKKTTSQVGLFHKKTVVKWRRIDTEGNSYYGGDIPQSLLPSVGSLIEAREIIASIKRGRVQYSC